MLTNVRATAVEKASDCPGDDLVERADVALDRGVTLPGTPEQVWPWLQQLGKRRAGWYLPRRVERLLPPSRRAIRHLDAQWQQLRVGDTIPDYGGRHETFTVVDIVAPERLVYESRRGRVHVSWALLLRPVGDHTRVHLRLRLGPLKRPWIASTAGEFFDALTIAGMAAGLRERIAIGGQNGR